MLREVVDRVGWITLNRPAQMNAVTVALSRELENAALLLAGDPAVNVIVIRGAGGNFCTGTDTAEVERLRVGGASALRPLFTAFRSACDTIAHLAVPVVAAIEGAVKSGGFELMQAADIVLVNAEASIADDRISAGLIPGRDCVHRLGQLVGRQHTMGLLLSGDTISGADAALLGLAYRSFGPDDFDEGVRRFATDLAGRSREAVLATKRLIRSSLGEPPEEFVDDDIRSVVAQLCGRAGSLTVATAQPQGA